MLTLFEELAFEASAASPDASSAAGDAVTAAVEPEAIFLSAVLPFLKPDQRERLAVDIELRGTSPQQQEED